MVRDQALALSGLLEPQDRRPERLSAPARRALAGGVQRRAHLGDEPGRQTATAAGSTRSGGGPCPIPRWPPSTPPAARSARSSGCGPTRRSSRSSRLNDPVYVEAAQALARRIVREGGADVRGRVRYRPCSSACAGRRGPSRSSRSSALYDGGARAIPHRIRRRPRRPGHRAARPAPAGDEPGRAGRLDDGRQRALEPRRRLDQRR